MSMTPMAAGRRLPPDRPVNCCVEIVTIALPGRDDGVLRSAVGDDLCVGRNAVPSYKNAEAHAFRN
jgi:hypothetical protein